MRDEGCRVGVSRPYCSPLRVTGDTDDCMVFLNEIAVFPCDVGVCMIRAHLPRHKLISPVEQFSQQPEPRRVFRAYSRQ